MNFKKNQRRIPMNFKKIIPLTFAALSVAGALSACSDNKVVGADEQNNTVAEHLEEKEVASRAASLLKNSAKSNAATTVILSIEYNDDGTRNIDSTEVLDGGEAYNKFMSDVVAVDTLNTSYKTGEGWKHFTYLDFESHSLFGKYYSMQDENGIAYGPISFSDDAVKMGDGWHLMKSVLCWNESKWITSNDSVFEFPEFLKAYTKQFDLSTKLRLEFSTRDSLLLSQFVEDCIAADGTISKGWYSIDTQFMPNLECFLPREDSNPIRLPYWEKYASYVVDNCRSDIVPEMRIPTVPCPEDKCENYHHKY